MKRGCSPPDSYNEANLLLLRGSWGPLSILTQLQHIRKYKSSKAVAPRCDHAKYKQDVITACWRGPLERVVYSLFQNHEQIFNVVCRLVSVFTKSC